jgi:hypothetical protein
MKLNEWAARWNISSWALDDLRTIFGIAGCESRESGQSESAIQSEIRLEAVTVGARLWRNNVGATYARDGSFLRYGLANESGAVNARVKSADLIGIRPVKIEPGHVGWTIGQFVSREVKAGGWQYRATDREQAQLRWAELIMSLGGDAVFATGKGTL